MNQPQQIQPTNTLSRLERFNIGFEYDKTLQQLKREMRERTQD